MLAKQTRQTQQAKRVVEVEVLRFHPFGQRRSLGLRVLITHLPALHVRAVLPEQQIHQVAGFGIFAQRFRAIGLLLEDQFRLVGIEIRGGDFPRQRGLDQFLLAIVSDAFRLQIGTETTNPHHARQAFEINGAGGTGIDIPFPLMNLGFKPLVTFVKPLEIGKPLHGSMGDLVEGVLHPGREPRIHQIREMLLKQRCHREGGEARGEGIVQQGGVSTVHDRADDRGIGGGPADAFLLQHLHQRRFAEPRWWLGLVAESFHLLQGWCVANTQRGEQHFLAFQGRIRIITALHIGTEKSREIDALAAGLEHGVGSVEIHREHGQTRLSHLTGHGALPDQLIQGQIPPVQARLLGSPETLAGGADRFMGFLGIAGLGAELAHRLAEVLLAVAGFHTAACCADGLIRQMHRIRSHVGDEAPLIEPLSAAHRLPRRQPQLPV